MHEYLKIMYRLLPGKYGDPLEAIKASKYAGDAVIRDIACEKWVFTSKLYNSTIYVNKLDTTIPVRIEGRNHKVFFEYDILTFSPDPFFTKDEFELPKSCKSKGVFSVV